MKTPDKLHKTKVIRFFILAYLFFALTIFGVGSSLTSRHLQKKHKAELSQILQDENTSSLDHFFYGMTETSQKTLLVLGILFGILAGFCFTAANRVNNNSL